MTPTEKTEAPDLHATDVIDISKNTRQQWRLENEFTREQLKNVGKYRVKIVGPFGTGE